MHHRHNKAVSPPRRSGKSVAVGPLSGDRKRRASSSVSSVSSVSSIEDLSDLENSEEDDADDEEDQPRVFTAPSHGAKSKSKAQKMAPKPAPKPAKKTTNNKKRKRNVKVSHDDSYDDDDNDSEDSSDDVYAAVDYISDGDDEDQDMEKLEEAMILESEGDHRAGGFLGAAGAGDGHGHHWAGPTNVFDDHMLLAGASFFDEEQLYSAMETFGETDLASEAVEAPIQMPRHVHFEPQSDSSSDSDSHTEDEIPGDFLQQDSLDPQLRRMIENDNENTRHQRRRRTSEDMFGESDYGHSNIYHVESDAVSEKSESSGYESMLNHTQILDSLLSPKLLVLTTAAKPMMAKLQMKTSHPQPPLHIPVRFCGGTPRPP